MMLRLIKKYGKFIYVAVVLLSILLYFSLKKDDLIKMNDVFDISSIDLNSGIEIENTFSDRGGGFHIEKYSIKNNLNYTGISEIRISFYNKSYYSISFFGDDLSKIESTLKHNFKMPSIDKCTKKHNIQICKYKINSKNGEMLNISDKNITEAINSWIGKYS